MYRPVLQAHTNAKNVTCMLTAFLSCWKCFLTSFRSFYKILKLSGKERLLPIRKHYNKKFLLHCQGCFVLCRDEEHTLSCMGMHRTSALTLWEVHMSPPIFHLHEPNYQFWYWRNHQAYGKLKAWQHYFIEATVLLKSVWLAFKKQTVIYNPEKKAINIYDTINLHRSQCLLTGVKEL